MSLNLKKNPGAYGGYEDPKAPWILGTLIVVGVVVACIVLFFVVGLIGKEYSRYQKRADAENNVKVTNTKIRNVEQRVEISKQEARIRVVEARGIRAAQDLIAKTLTDQYLQHEAIEAQKLMARSSNHTQVYVPAGQNGLPIVQTAPDPNKQGGE